MYSLYIRISMNPIDWFDSPFGADAEHTKKKKNSGHFPPSGPGRDTADDAPTPGFLPAPDLFF